MISSLCSISDLTSSIPYNWSIMWLRHLNILIFSALCVFPSFKYFVTVCCMRFSLWYQYELLASRFIVSATTLVLISLMSCVHGRLYEGFETFWDYIEQNDEFFCTPTQASSRTKLTGWSAFHSLVWYKHSFGMSHNVLLFCVFSHQYLPFSLL